MVFPFLPFDKVIPVTMEPKHLNQELSITLVLSSTSLPLQGLIILFN